MNKLKYANGNNPLTIAEKLKMITEAAGYYGEYMTALGFDWKNDPNSSDTPMRVAKAFVNDLAEGVYNEPPKITAFDNIDGYKHLIVRDALECCSNLGLSQETIFKNTLSCYNPINSGNSCGECGACNDRILAFNKIGIKDSIIYE